MTRALSLIRPMSAAIVHGTKRIENRRINLPQAMRGVPTVIAVHAGRKWDENYASAVNHIDGAGHVDGEYRPAPSYAARCRDEGLVGLMRLTGRVFTNSDPCDPTMYDVWYSGPFGYEIDGAVAFPTPIPCPGMLGFWPVSDTHVALVREQCGAIDMFYDWVGETHPCPTCASRELCEPECSAAPWNTGTL